MNITTRVYKAFRVNPGGELESCWAREAMKMLYSPCVWTAPRKYGPMVFLQKSVAMNYAETLDSPHFVRIQVWECLAEDVRKCDSVLWISDLAILNPETVRRRMDRMFARTGKWFRRQDAPSGTYLTTRVKPVKLVYEHGYRNGAYYSVKF